MIFYFSATGNSLYAAKKLAEEDEQLIDITDALRNQEYSYTVPDGEDVGFVFPVYCWTLSKAVRRFVQNLQLENAGYIYAVITCGGSIRGTATLLDEELQKHDLMLASFYPLVMTDDTVFYWDIDPDEVIAKTLEHAEEEIAAIKEAISQHEIRPMPYAWFSRLMIPVYSAMSGTKNFSVTDACISCGQCERRCPDEVIRLTDGKPVWTKSKCTKCSGCINSCPVSAIQYGKKTAERRRYHNPKV